MGFTQEGGGRDTGDGRGGREVLVDAAGQTATDELVVVEAVLHHRTRRREKGRLALLYKYSVFGNHDEPQLP